MLVLGIETSCDETAAAIVRNGREIVSSVIASQIATHTRFGGVVPELASREHLDKIVPIVEEAFTRAATTKNEIDGIAVTIGPGLIGSLLVGVSYAKAMAFALDKPLVGVNHIEGHIYSVCFENPPVEHPALALIVSGGHTNLFFVPEPGKYKVVSRTRDDAAGEAFDKVAKMLGLGYPGGPEIEKHAGKGDPARFDLPRSMLGSEDFSFSGLKTAVRYLLPKLGVIPSERPNDQLLADLCASFQQAIVDVLVRKTIAAAKKHDVDLVTVSGGVSCNEELRRQLREGCAREGFGCKSAEPWLCTDNAAMIAFVASLRLQAGLASKVTEEIDPNLALV
jgi:N6-L-threonylcarbamoyladenine synthase